MKFLRTSYEEKRLCASDADLGEHFEQEMQLMCGVSAHKFRMRFSMLLTTVAKTINFK